MTLIFPFIKNTELDKKIKIATKVDLKAEKDKVVKLQIH